MKMLFSSFLLLLPLLGLLPKKNNGGEKTKTNTSLVDEVSLGDSSYGLFEEKCESVFGNNVTTYTVKNGSSEVGRSVWISRKSGDVNAKYFAHKKNGNLPHHRYAMWRKNGNRDVVLKSSGAYATSFSPTDGLPVGITVDNGAIVNKKYSDKMDGLVIVYATGGIAVSDLEQGDLYLDAIGREVDVKDFIDRSDFLKWAKSENATVFQTHLLAYDNTIKVGDNGSPSTARRKFLILAKSSSGELFHIIFYLRDQQYTLYDATVLVLNYMKNSKKMDVIAMLNLDTGGFDILNTGGDATDCDGKNIWGTTDNYDDMTNLLTYEYNP